jgi:hypothetical protein
MGDIDLLVRHEDLPEVATIFRGLGFREMDRRPGFAQAFYYTLEFFRDRHGWIIVEPHWSLAYPPFTRQVDMEEVWRRCERGRVVGVESWVLGREELLLHLCLHLTHHDGTAPLLWFYELDRLLREKAEALDWSRVVSLAGKAKLGFLLLEALQAVKLLFATPIPDRVLDQLLLESQGAAEGRLTRLLSGAPGVDGKESLAVLLTLKGLRAKLGYALALLFPSPQFMVTHYGLSRRRQLGLAYLRRFCYLSREGFKGLRRLRERPPTNDAEGGQRGSSHG